MNSTIQIIMEKHKAGKLICQKCKKVIFEPAFIIVSGQIITTLKAPTIFTCPEQAANYAQGIIMHSVCWIDTLREYGNKLYDMNEIAKKYNEEKKNGMGQNKTSK